MLLKEVNHVRAENDSIKKKYKSKIKGLKLKNDELEHVV